MPVLTRRDAMYASGCALATPLAGKLLVNAAYGQSPDAALVRPPVAPKGAGKLLNPDLQAFAVSNVPGFLAKAQLGTLSLQDHQDLSRRLHLYARHVSAVNTEPFRTAVVSSLDTSKAVDLSKTAGAKHLFANVLAHNPGASQGEFQKSLNFSPEHLALGKRALSANSIGWHLHTIADSVRWMGLQQAQGAPIVIAPAAYDPELDRRLLSYATLHPDISAGLVPVRFGICGLKAKQWCQFAATVVAAGLTLAVILAALPESAAAAAVASLAAEIGWTVEAVTAAAKIGALISGTIGAMCGIFL